MEVPASAEQLAIGDGGAGQPLAFLTAAGQPASAAPVEVPRGFGDDVSVAVDSVERRRTVTFGVAIGEGSMMSDDAGLEFTIDAKPFDPRRTDIVVDAGAVEEWTLVNRTAMDHPFHLHSWPFRVLGDDAWPGWKDTVTANVPRRGLLRLLLVADGSSLSGLPMAS